MSSGFGEGEYRKPDASLATLEGQAVRPYGLRDGRRNDYGGRGERVRHPFRYASGTCVPRPYCSLLELRRPERTRAGNDMLGDAIRPSWRGRKLRGEERRLIPKGDNETPSQPSPKSDRAGFGGGLGGHSLPLALLDGQAAVLRRPPPNLPHFRSGKWGRRYKGGCSYRYARGARCPTLWQVVYIPEFYIVQGDSTPVNR